MKGLSFMMARRAFPVLRIIPLALLRILQMGGGKESRRAPSLVFPKMGVQAPALSASVLIKERFFSRVERSLQSSREMEKNSASVRQTVYKGAEKQFSFFKKSRMSRQSLKESFRSGEKETSRLRQSLESKYVSRLARLREYSSPGPRAGKERTAYFASFLKENNLRSKASQSLLREALLDKKESHARVNASFLKESMRESFTHLKERGQAQPPAPGGKTVHIGTVHIEGAQIRDFESFKRELSSAVEEL